MALPERACEECGESFAPSRRDQRFCKAYCRVKANRRPTKTGRAKSDAAGNEPAAAPPNVVKLSGVVSPPAPEQPSLEAEGGLATQIRSSLENIGALETVAGMAALMLARQIERAQDSGSAMATMTKELSRLMGEARAEAAPQQRDGADDVMARAAAKIMRLVGDKPA